MEISSRLIEIFPNVGQHSYGRYCWCTPYYESYFNDLGEIIYEILIHRQIDAAENYLTERADEVSGWE